MSEGQSPTTTADTRHVHFFREHPVMGVNYRPTRLVEKLPHLRVCDVCRMVPKLIQLLPCDHVLCVMCHKSSCEGVDGISPNGRCPMDGKSFSTLECRGHDFHDMNPGDLKVYCWNEANGCQFVGPMEEMLRHYDNDECQFHVVRCFRCGARVLHRKLSAHYLSACNYALTSYGEDYASSDSAATIVRIVHASLKKMNAVLTNPHHYQLEQTFRNWMKELVQQLREHESRLAVLSREVKAPAQPGSSQASAPTSPVTEYQPRNLGDLLEDAAYMRLYPPIFFADLPSDLMQAMRPTSLQVYPQHAFSKDSVRGGVQGILYLAEPTLTTRSWSEVRGPARYLLTLRNCDTDVPLKGEDVFLAKVTVLHTLNCYFTVEVSVGYRLIYVRIELHGAGAQGPQGSLISLGVTVFDGQPSNGLQMSYCEDPCFCNRDADRLLHFRRTYTGNVYYLKRKGFFRDRTMQFQIELTHNQTARS